MWHADWDSCAGIEEKMVPTLEITGACGGSQTFTLSNYTPDGNYILVTGDDSGTTPIPSGTCAGADLPLATPNVRTMGTVDGNGDHVFDIVTPACGPHVVAVDLGTCVSSAPVLLE